MSRLSLVMDASFRFYVESFLNRCDTDDNELLLFVARKIREMTRMSARCQVVILAGSRQME